jgi:nucleotide-binding universal stress UspA family protein
MKTLLVPTDFSKASLNAFQYAIKLSRQIDAGIKVVHVYQNEIPDLGMTSVVSPLIENDKLVANDLKTFVSQGKMSKTAKTLVHTEGYDCMAEPAEKIVSLSKSSSIDLVVMGATGAHDALEKWFGSVSSYTAQEAFCPVLLIPDGVRFRKPKNILYVCNLDVLIQAATLDRLAFIAQCLGSKVHVLHVDTNLNNEKDVGLLVNREWNLVECERFSFKAAINKQDNVLKALDVYAAHHHIDLVVISTHHRTIFQKIFHKSLTKTIAMDSNLPLLVLHKEDKFSLF